MESQPQISEFSVNAANFHPWFIQVRKKAKIWNRYNKVPHLTQDTTWESDKNARKHHILESQEVSPFPAGDHKAAMIRQDSMTDTKHG